MSAKRFGKHSPQHSYDGGGYAYEEAGAYEHASHAKKRSRLFVEGSPWPMIIGIACSCMLVVALLFGIRVAMSLGAVRAEASTITAEAKHFLDAAKSGDGELLESSAHAVSNSAHNIHDELATSTWQVASHIPIIGSDVRNVRILSDVLVDVADSALVPMSQSKNIMALKDLTKDDAINTAALTTLVSAVEEASPAIGRADATLSQLPDMLIPPAASMMQTARETVSLANDVITRSRPLFPYLPDLLGQNGHTRKYLIIAENTAEIRARGGFAGGFGIMTITDGKIDVGDFRGLHECLSQDENSAGATAEEIRVFGERVDTHHGDHNAIPDFSRVGELYFNIWQFYQEEDIDGAFGLDPVFLQSLLGLVGGIETSRGVTVDGTNAAAILLNQAVYWWSARENDAFYAEVAGLAFDKIVDNLGEINLADFLTAVSNAAKDDRCLMWLRDMGAEEAVKAAGFGGELPHDPAKPQTGIYITDGSVSKLSYYLSVDKEVSGPRENSDGSKSYGMKVTITNNYDPDAYDTMPAYMEVQVPGRSDHDIVERIDLIAPEGGRISDVSTERVNTYGGDPSDGGWKEDTYQGLDIWTQNVRLQGKEAVVLTYTVTTSPEARKDLEVHTTPVMPPDIAYWNTLMEH